MRRALILLLYIAIGWSTYGIKFHECTRQWMCKTDATVAAVLWPVYWLSYPVDAFGDIAISLFEPKECRSIFEQNCDRD